MAKGGEKFQLKRKKKCIVFDELRKNFARVSGHEKVMKIHKGLCSRNYYEIHRCRCDTASAFQL